MEHDFELEASADSWDLEVPLFFNHTTYEAAEIETDLRLSFQTVAQFTDDDNTDLEERSGG